MSINCPSLIGDLYPHLCVAVDHYCERTSADLAAEPINALTNAAFLVAAWRAWRLQSAPPVPRLRLPLHMLTLLTAAIGLGSFLFHTVATRWAEWGDVIPILLFMLVCLWLLLTAFLASPSLVKAVVLVLYAAATLYLEAAVPGRILWGGALYLPTLVAMATISAFLYRRHPAVSRGLALATAVFFLSFAARSADAAVCPAFPLGTHFIWHLLNATLLFLLIRLVVRQAGLGRGRQ